MVWVDTRKGVLSVFSSAGIISDEMVEAVESFWSEKAGLLAFRHFNGSQVVCSKCQKSGKCRSILLSY